MRWLTHPENYRFEEKSVHFDMPYDLAQLHAFVTVATTGSLGRAAQALNVTQPALSRTIQRLEMHVGAALFERHSKGMHLTDFGRALLPRATLLQHESALAKEEIDAMRGLAKGSIRVGAVGSIAAALLPRAIDAVLRKWPQLRVEVLEGFWDRLSSALVSHEIDLALAAAAPDSAEITAVKDCQWTDRSHVIAAIDHPLRRKRALSFSDLMNERWVVPVKGSEPYLQLAHALARSGLGMPEAVVETRSILVMKNLVAHSGFLCWMNEPVIEVDRRAGLLDALPVRDSVAVRTLTAHRRRAGLLPAPAVRLLDELRVLAAERKSTSAAPRKRDAR
jgi:DNA-binding transcriptional LysR family regulator